ncbi:DUF4038 domain-containing protein [Micromonospora sp. NPDC051300]|uniref:apiosidase-like domain-containing protein n=1 Tax=Micromonospora sp. NPDC051300 TaxID=3364286 RepID=UPI0037917D2A
MTALTVHGNHFRRHGAKEFLLADTAWAAVPRSGAAEWAAYLRHRRRQGFTAVLISLLPIPHGRSIGPDDQAPFAVRPDGTWDLDRPDPEYRTVARQRVAAAAEAGLTPFCVPFWNNYVPGTWGAARSPDTVMTTGQIRDHLDDVLDALRDVEVVWLVSGDDDFAGVAAPGCYEMAVRRIRTLRPGSLVGAHPAVASLPPSTLAHRLDFHCYQSGHDKDHLPRCAGLAGRLRDRHRAAPVLNLEPCYEDHLSAGAGHRHTAADVRQAAWTSVLAGATAGVGYGAHGVWSWHRDGDTFTDPAYAGEPAAVDRSLHLAGARDMALLRRLVEDHDLFDLAPRPSVGTSVPVAATADLATVAAFVPAGVGTHIPVPVKEHRVQITDLNERHPRTTEPTVAAGAPALTIAARSVDRLVVARRR